MTRFDLILLFVRFWLDQKWYCQIKSETSATFCVGKDTQWHKWPNSWKDSCLWVYRKQVILALKGDATSPPPPKRMHGCAKGHWPENKVTWQCPASLSQDKSNYSLYLWNKSVCLTEQEVRQTDMSLTLNILQTLVSSRLCCTGCVTHTFHIPVDVSGSPARQLIFTHAF